MRTITRVATFLLAVGIAAATFLTTSNDAMAAAEAEVTINAANGLDGKAITEPVSWTVTKLDKNGKPAKTPAVQEAAAVLKTKLKPGQYQVLGRSSQGLAAKQTFTVGKEPVVRTLTFGMSEISIKMITSKGRKPVKEPIQWEMLTYVKGQPNGGQLIEMVKAPTATFNVPAGGYVVRATYNGTTADLVIPLKAGQAYEYTLNLYAGHAEPAAFNGKKKIVQDVTWQVVRATPNEKGEHELVAEQHAPEPKIMLREGKYLLIARYGDMWGKENLNVTAGELSKVKVKLAKDAGMPVIASK